MTEACLRQRLNNKNPGIPPRVSVMHWPPSTYFVVLRPEKGFLLKFFTIHTLCSSRALAALECMPGGIGEGKSPAKSLPYFFLKQDIKIVKRKEYCIDYIKTKTFAKQKPPQTKWKVKSLTSRSLFLFPFHIPQIVARCLLFRVSVVIIERKRVEFASSSLAGNRTSIETPPHDRQGAARLQTLSPPRLWTVYLFV